MVNEEMKNKYDVIGEKKNGKIIIVHNNGTNAKSTYESVYEFNMDMQKLKVNGVVVESING